MPETANEAIRDLTIRHMVDMERFKGSEVAILLRLLAEADAEVAAKIERRLDGLSQADKERMLRGEYTTTRLEALRDALAEQAARAEAIMLGQVGTAMAGAAEATVAFQAQAVTANVVLQTDWVTPSDDLLRAVVRENPFDGDGRGPKLLAEMSADWSRTKQNAVRGAIRQGIIQGESIPDIMRRIRGTRAAGFKDGALSASKTTAERIARTGVSHVVNRAREEAFKANADIIRGVQWVSSLDTRLCPTCLSFSGKVYPVGEGPRPPQPHPNCLPGDALVLPCGDITNVTRRAFHGDFVVIRTAAGRELTITPNHLVATNRGWVAAKALNPGDKVIGNGGTEREKLVYDLNDDVEARVHDVTEAFFGSREVTSSEVPTAAPDFHGDGAGSEVAVVGAYGGLLSKGDAARGKRLSDLNLNRADLVCHRLARLSGLALLLERAGSSANRIMRRLRQTFPFNRRRAVHPGLLLRGAVAKGDAVGDQKALHLRSHDPELVGDELQTPAALVEPNDLCAICGENFVGSEGFDAPSPDGDARFFQDAADGTLRHAETFTDGLLSLSGVVQLDDVVSVSLRKDVLCHVYNLETTRDAYFAQGLLVHNCRCTVTAALNRSAGPGTRYSNKGDIPGDIGADDWFAMQTRAEQDEILGPTRAELWRKGGMKLDKGFVDKTGRVFTLDELRRRDAEAFRKAGL